MSANITRWIQHHVHKLEENLSQTDPSDGSVYTGHAGKNKKILLAIIFDRIISGIALLYMRLAALFPEQKNQYMSKAKSLIDLALKQLDGNRLRCPINFIEKFNY